MGVPAESGLVMLHRPQVRLGHIGIGHGSRTRAGGKIVALRKQPAGKDQEGQQQDEVPGVHYFSFLMNKRQLHFTISLLQHSKSQLHFTKSHPQYSKSQLHFTKSHAQHSKSQLHFKKSRYHR
jgi:hypothetical protein